MTFYEKLESLTTDPEILELITGARLEFDQEGELPSLQNSQCHLNHSERSIKDTEIEKLLSPFSRDRTRKRRVASNDFELEKTESKHFIPSS